MVHAWSLWRIARSPLNRQVRQSQSYARRAPTREPYDYVLILCEGSKTEPNYFRALRQAYRLSSANVEIAKPGANDPLSIVKKANDRITKDKFDRAYCVFDRDGWANYDQALQLAADCQNGRNGRLIAVPSVPCFEIWILLHFVYSTAPYYEVGRNSACDNVLRALRTHFADYNKGHQDVYHRVAGQMTRAITHAQRLADHNQQTGSINPSTRVHDLVHYLCNLKTP